jgi:serpin B
MRSIPDIDKYTLSIANSIWFTNENFNVNQDFLQTNADYYAADIYKTKFDKRAVKDVNSWVNKKTDGMIKDLIDEFDPATVMCLVNALAFEAEWSEPYQKGDVNDEKFTKEDGTKQDAELMYSTESSYISDENSSGFIKHYSGHRFAFSAILPNEDISVSEYINSLDGASLSDMLSNAKNATVRTSLPKFEFEYGVKLNDVLKTMGMTDAFDPKSADFSGISSDNGLYIGEVMHKTYIQVAEKGTRAGAATSVEMLDGSAEPEEIYEVYLNRPFIYMLIDLQSNTPLFIGTVMEITN